MIPSFGGWSAHDVKAAPQGDHRGRSSGWNTWWLRRSIKRTSTGARANALAAAMLDFVPDEAPAVAREREASAGGKKCRDNTSTDKDMSINGRVALVPGAGQEISHAIALRGWARRGRTSSSINYWASSHPDEAR
jgi:hypothetical protein